jgi:hypothetical protein
VPALGQDSGLASAGCPASDSVGPRTTTPHRFPQAGQPDDSTVGYTSVSVLGTRLQRRTAPAKRDETLVAKGPLIRPKLQVGWENSVLREHMRAAQGGAANQSMVCAMDLPYVLVRLAPGSQWENVDSNLQMLSPAT